MEFILQEIRATFDCGIWYPVMSSILMLPDACGSVEFTGENKRPRDRYIEWYDKWVYPNFYAPNVTFDGSVVYIVRNAMIHESTIFTRGQHGFDKIFFMPPSGTNISANFNLSYANQWHEHTTFQVEIERFLNAIEYGVRNWLQEVRSDVNKRRDEALNKLVQLRPNGDSPFIGMPVIS